MRWIICLAAAAALTGCGTTEFRAYQTRTNLYEGDGGTVKMVDGVEIWDSAPARKFSVLGVVFDERPGAMIPMALLDGDMVKEAKKRNGDALIRMGSNSTLVGVHTVGQVNASAYGNTAYASGSSTSVPLRRSTSNFAVIKYAD